MVLEVLSIMYLTLNSLTKKEDNLLEKVYYHYSNAFPPEERRNKKQFFDLLDNPHSSIQSISIASEDVGYIVTWQLSDAIFIEHFEIFPENRGRQIGGKVLDFLNRNHNLVVLETEPDNYGDIAQRRINFYKRNGFNIVDKAHIQPSYEEDKDSISLFLMASNSIEDLAYLKKELYAIVYNI